MYILFQRDPAVEGIECEVEVDIDNLLDMDDDHQRTQYLQVINKYLIICLMNSSFYLPKMNKFIFQKLLSSAKSKENIKVCKIKLVYGVHHIKLYF